jgi:hypothetical protein
MMTSAAERPSSAWISTGMPRPLSDHGDRFVGVDGDHDLVAMAGQRLVDGVIDHLEHHVVQAAAVVGVADVHSGPFSDGVEPSQDFDFAGIVDVVIGHGVAKGIRNRQLLGIPRSHCHGLTECRATTSPLMDQRIEIINLYMASYATWVIARVLRKVKQQQPVARYLPVNGECGLETKLPIDVEPKPAHIEVFRLLVTVYVENRNSALHEVDPDR